MNIRLLVFATARQALGREKLEITVPDGSTVADLASILQDRYPDLTELWPRLAIAVDGDLVDPQSTLREGSEVALLPPVSGGAPQARASLVETPIDINSMSTAMGDSSCGALVVFVGTVRDRHLDRQVAAITYDAYRSMAVQRLEAIADELENSSDDLRVRITHRLGEVPAGEASVVIAVASPHRDAAYEASREALERLKREVPIWKLEHYVEGPAVWREEESLV